MKNWTDLNKQRYNARIKERLRPANDDFFESTLDLWYNPHQQIYFFDNQPRENVI